MLRHRIPFRIQEGDEGDESTPVVMDEQEQDKLVQSLLAQNEIENLEHTRVLQGLVCGSIFLQLVFLAGHQDGSSWTPISPILSSDAHPSQALIPIPRLWVLVNVTQHAHDIVFADPYLLSLIPLTPFFNLRKQRIWAVTLLPLALALILRSSGPHGADTAQIAWWSIPPLMAGLVALIRRWIEDGRQDLQKLEELKYESKGA